MTSLCPKPRYPLGTLLSQGIPYLLAVGHQIMSLTSSSWDNFLGTYLPLTCQHGGQTEYLGSNLVNASGVVRLQIATNICYKLPHIPVHHLLCHISTNSSPTLTISSNLTLVNT